MSEGASVDQSGSVELLWGRRDRPARGPRPALSLETIAQAAMDIADAEGLAAISMQRVAGDLGFTKMSLYRYVASKSELIAVMIDRAVGDPPDLSTIPGGWRPRLEEFVRLLTQVWEDHPWLPWATMGDRVMGPREVGWIESALSALSDTNLTGGERLDAVYLLFGHIRNTQSMSTAGTQPWGADKQLKVGIADLIRDHADTFPALTEAIEATADAAHDNGRAFGLALILDGLATLIAARPSSPS